MPEVYWPGKSGLWIPVSDLLNDLIFAEKWGCTPWEASGKKPKKWRPVYRTLDSIFSEVNADLQPKH